MLAICAVGVLLMLLGTLLVIRGTRPSKPMPLALVRPEWSRESIPEAAAQRELDRELDTLLGEIETARRERVMARAFSRPHTPTGVIMPQIDAYIRDAMVATGTPVEPLPRVRSARGSHAPEIHSLTVVEVGDTFEVRSLLHDDPATTFGEDMGTLPAIRRKMA